jgi:hypothetical protein
MAACVLVPFVNELKVALLAVPAVEPQANVCVVVL